MCLVLRLEEVLPRPAAGLLHRMLRLAPVDCEQRGAAADPALLVHAEAPYQLSVVAYQVPSPPACGLIRIHGAVCMQPAQTRRCRCTLGRPTSSAWLPARCLPWSACQCGPQQSRAAHALSACQLLHLGAACAC